MEFKETKIATYTEGNTRVQLLKITSHTKFEPGYINSIIVKYQIRMNRKRVYTTGFEYDARKYFANIVQYETLRLKIK